MEERIRGEIRAGEGQMERESRNKEMGVEEVQRNKCDKDSGEYGRRVREKNN